MSENTVAITRVKEEISRRLSQFSRAEKMLALYLLDHWMEISLVSIEKLAQKSGVSTATVTRFARHFGFRGYYDFKEKIKETEMRRFVRPIDKFSLLRETDVHGKKSLTMVARQDVKNINRLMAILDESTFEEFVSLVEAAPRIYAFGVSISAIFADFLAFTFNRIHKETHSLNEGAITVEEKILTRDPGDLVIFLSFYPYSKSTIEYARLAIEQKLHVVAITDDTQSPIPYSKLRLVIPRENILYTTSITAFTVLINAVATELALKHKDRIVDTIMEEDSKLRQFFLLP
jgi:DNA-binding MurR/RpiR family transcriptional regulator